MASDRIVCRCKTVMRGRGWRRKKVGVEGMKVRKGGG